LSGREHSAISPLAIPRLLRKPRPTLAYGLGVTVIFYHADSVNQSGAKLRPGVLPAVHAASVTHSHAPRSAREET